MSFTEIQKIEVHAFPVEEVTNGGTRSLLLSIEVTQKRTFGNVLESLKLTAKSREIAMSVWTKLESHHPDTHLTKQDIAELYWLQMTYQSQKALNACKTDESQM